MSWEGIQLPGQCAHTGVTHTHPGQATFQDLGARAQVQPFDGWPSWFTPPHNELACHPVLTSALSLGVGAGGRQWEQDG